MITEEQVLNALRQVIDPELGINIVDLGLVYSVDIEENRVQVAMTMTTPACPLTGMLTNAAEAAIWQLVPEVESVHIRLVWEPPWNPGLISEQGTLELGWVGA
ncbi:MAG: metal-sulfur cluster assembly factor [Anaerolineae bacterium]|nr:metal-sulfur cluster assembly factor [Anaerolineae bacterium]